MVCYLLKVDMEKNQRRFYNLHLAPDLFGGWSLVREWGRLGSGGTLRIMPFDTEEEARQALKKVQEAKLKHGYSLNH